MADPQLASALLHARGVSEPLLVDVRRATARAAVELLIWQGHGSLPPLPRAPLLLIAALAAGERRLSDDVVGLMTSALPGIPLLLLCEEALVRPSLTTQGGRVSLLGPPLTAARIHRRVDALLHDRRPATQRHATLRMGLEPLAGPVATREEERPRWWVATVACHGQALAARGPFVSLRHHATAGLTALVPLDEGRARSVDADGTEHVFALVEQAQREHGSERALEDALGASAGVVHLSRAADEWFVYWPALASPLTIHSATRLPRRWDLATTLRRTGSKVLRLPAVGGDLVAALSAHLPAQSGGGEDTAMDLAQMMASGGSAAVRCIEGRLRETLAPRTGLLVEVL